MANFTDSVVAIIHNALVATRQALEPDNDPQAKEIIKMIVECERILSGSSSQAVGTSSSTSTSASNSYVAAMNRYFNKKQKPDQSLPVPMGAAASATVIQKTKALFSMFHPTEFGYYEPEPIGGSASVSIASKIVAGHKVQKTKALFEMFHLTEWRKKSRSNNPGDYIISMAYPSNQLRIRNNGTVRPINVPPEDLQQLREVLNSNRFTPSRKETVQKRITGCCCVCGSVPTMQVSYDADGATRIEKYCDKCIKSVYSREAVLWQISVWLK